MITKTHIYKAHHQFHLSFQFSVGSSGKVAIRRSFLPRGSRGSECFAWVFPSDFPPNLQAGSPLL